MEKGEQTSDASKLFSPKELYKELITMNGYGSVPQAFVRLDQEHSKAAAASSLSSVPIIDLHALAMKQDHKEDLLRRGVLDKLHSASQNWGLFLVLS